MNVYEKKGEENGDDRNTEMHDGINGKTCEEDLDGSRVVLRIPRFVYHLICDLLSGFLSGNRNC